MKQRILTLLLCLVALFTTASAQDNYDATTMGTIVRYYETAKWAQSSPFNNQCWTDATQQTHAKTGCVPTAFAIIMRHHGFPTEGIGTLKNGQTGVVITDRTYDYSKMPLTNGTGWTAEQQNEVAKLISHLGHAFGVTWGYSETSVSIGNTMSEKMRDYFNYKYTPVSNQYAGSGQMYDFETWKNNLKNSLLNGCPVPYASNNQISGGRHMFIVDGFTENDYFHFNFGWGDETDGWFKLDNITPTGNNYSWLNSGDGYDSKHQAYFNLMPNATTYPVTASVLPANAGTVTVSPTEQIAGAKVTLTATANPSYTFVNWTLNGNVVSTEKTYNATVVAGGNEYVANFLTVGNTRVNVSVSYNSSYGTVTYNSSAVSGTGITPKQNSEVTLVATPLDGYVFNGWTVTKGTDSTNYAGTELTFVATEDMRVEANFSTSEIDYSVTASTLTKSGNEQGSSSFCSTYTFNGGVAFTLTTTIDDVEAYALATSNQYIDFYASAHTKNVSNAYITNIKYTLSAPEGYLIKKYSFDLKSSSSYSINVNYGNNNNVTIDNSGYKTISETNIGKQSVSFILSTDYNKGRAKAYVENFSITLEKISGTGGGSTPTPDPEPDPTPTTYAVTTTANPVAGGTAKFAVGTGSQQTEGNVNDGESITLYATANTGYHFVKWTLNGNEVSTDVNYAVTNVTADAEYVANFEKNTYTIDVSTNGTGGSAMIGTETSTNVEHGASVTLTAVADDGYHFVNWTLNGNEVSRSATCSVTVSQAANYIANFEINTYTIDVSTNGTGGSASASAATAKHGASVTLTAVANDGYHFVNWTLNGSVVSTDAEYTFNAADNGEYIANFEIYTYTVNVSTNGTGGSAMIGTETSTIVEHGSEVTLTAEANDGYDFAGWYNDEVFVSAEANYTFTVTSDINYTARFDQTAVTPPATKYAIHVTVASTDGTTVTNSAEGNVKAVIELDAQDWVTDYDFPVGANIKLIATNDYDNKAYLFDGWYKNNVLVSEDLEITVQATETATYQARFFRGCVVNAVKMITADVIQSQIMGITLENSTSIGYDASKRAVVKSGTTVKINTEVVDGYKVVWKDNDNITISEEDDLVVTVNEDVTYFAYFLPDVEVTKYYRFGYDFSQAQPAPAARTAATRAVGNVQTLTISYANGSFSDASNDGKRAKIWTSNNSSPTVALIATSNGIQYRNICKVSNSVSPLNLSLEAYPYNNGGVLTAGDGTTFTIAVDNEDYKITAYSISYNPYSKGYIDGANNNQLAESGLNVSNVSFTVKGTGTSSAVDIQSFTVTIQQVGGGETPEPEPEPETPKHYIQSTNENNNPLKMTIDTTAASVFYYDGSKLMSYANGKFVNEYGGKRGLQAYGAENAGIFIITENERQATIAIPTTAQPYYLHAAGTSGNYYVSNCSNNATCMAHTNFIIEEVKALPVTISTAKYATFYAPVAVKIPEGVYAWYLLEDDIHTDKGYASMTDIPAQENGDRVIPAYTAVVVGSETPATYLFEIVDDPGYTITGNKFRGTVAAEYIPVSSTQQAYILSIVNGKVGLYKAMKNGPNEESFLSLSHRAYLLLGAAPQSSNGFRLVFGTTAIEEIEAENNAEGIYDLSGRKLEGIYGPGIYIVNGKKVLVK